MSRKFKLGRRSSLKIKISTAKWKGLTSLKFSSFMKLIMAMSKDVPEP